MSPELRKDLIEHWEKRYEECCEVLLARIDSGSNTELIVDAILRHEIWVRLMELKGLKTRYRGFFSGCPSLD